MAPLFREALVSWGWRPRRRFKESRRPRGRVPPPGYFFLLLSFTHVEETNLSKASVTAMPLRARQAFCRRLLEKQRKRKQL